jgi:hypothetical protein
MRNPRLAVHTADARFWLRGARSTFDAIVVDAYRQPYIPFHLVSREFFELARDRLGPRGVVAINIGTPPGRTAIVTRIAQTMRAVFPTVHEWRFDEFNSIVVGYRSSTSVAAARTMLGRAPGVAAGPARAMANGIRDVSPGPPGDVLTDDHAPIEWLTDSALLTYLREGAPGARRGGS